MTAELLEAKIERLETPRPLAQEVETMSWQVSPSTGQVYGLLRVTRLWGVSRATLYRHRRSAEAVNAGGPGRGADGGRRPGGGDPTAPRGQPLSW